ncbi:MAG: peptide-methionine (R)-S-oxide reductase, partial [Hyphomonadaceae bacterium]
MTPLPLSRRAVFLGASALAMLGCTSEAAIPPAGDEARFAQAPERALSQAAWRARLSPAAFHVLREEGTELPGTSPLLNEHRAGTFLCAGCALPLFRSQWKFESGTGWPSFYRGMEANIG